MTCWVLIDTIAMIGSPAARGAVSSRRRGAHLSRVMTRGAPAAASAATSAADAGGRPTPHRHGGLRRGKSICIMPVEMPVRACVDQRPLQSLVIDARERDDQSIASTPCAFKRSRWAFILLRSGGGVTHSVASLVAGRDRRAGEEGLGRPGGFLPVGAVGSVLALLGWPIEVLPVRAGAGGAPRALAGCVEPAG